MPVRHLTAASEGPAVAKAIVDDRQSDLPISPIFWKLCLGHQMSIFDY